MGPRLADLPAPEARRLGGETLRTRRLGEGPRVVLLHGGPGLDHHLLVPLAVALSDRFEVWLPDLPGHGGHGGPAQSLKTTLERLGHWCAETEAAALGGHSLGAFLARELLRQKIVRARAAVLLCTPGPMRSREARRVQRVLAGETEEALRGELREELGREIDPLLEECLASASLRSPAKYARLTSELQPLLRAAVPPFDPRCPTLVVAGADDTLAPPSVSHAIAAATKGAREVVLPACAHFPWARSAGATAAAVTGFLREALE